MPDYTVQEGDCIWSIAKTSGIPPNTIWNHGNNASLKSQRKDPNILFPGDVVFIPDLNPGQFARPTDQTHKFQVQGFTAKLQIRLLDDGEPRANEKYTLTVDGKRITGQTDSDGWIKTPIPADAQQGELSLNNGNETHTIQLGYLDPIDQVSGVQGRLKNLGYYGGDVDGDMDDDTNAALSRFQADNGLDQTGDSDSATQAALQSAHGS